MNYSVGIERNILYMQYHNINMEVHTNSSPTQQDLLCVTPVVFEQRELMYLIWVPIINIIIIRFYCKTSLQSFIVLAKELKNTNHW